MTMMTTEPAQMPARQNGESIQVYARQVEDNGEFANLMDAGKFGHLQRVATLFANSQLVPAHFQGQVANCFIAMQMAMRMGVDPFMFMQNTYIVYGRPGMEAKLAIALINTSGLFVDPIDYEIVGSNPRDPNYKVRAFATRKSTGKTVHGEWVDWEIVRSEGWLDKKGSKWQTMPAMMFCYRAATFFGRLHCPERLMGMQTVDELRDTGELPADRNVASTGAQSRTDMLNEKVKAVANRGASEGQPASPASTEVFGQGTATARKTEQVNTDTGEVTEGADSLPTQPEPISINEPRSLLSHGELVESLNGAAIDLGVSEPDLRSWLTAAMAKAGATDEAKQNKMTPAARREVFRAFVGDHGGAPIAPQRS